MFFTQITFYIIYIVTWLIYMYLNPNLAYNYFLHYHFSQFVPGHIIKIFVLKCKLSNSYIFTLDLFNKIKWKSLYNFLCYS